MKTVTLYAFPMSCSFAVHLALRQSGVPFDLRWVARGPRRQIADPDFATLNPKRKVPALVLPDGEVLTEVLAVLLFLDEVEHPDRPAAERRRLVAWLSFLATELHKQILAPAYDPDTPPVAVQDARDRLLDDALAHLAAGLEGRETLLGGPDPSVADAYALWALLLIRDRYPEALSARPLRAFLRKMMRFPWVIAALEVERAALAGRAAWAPDAGREEGAALWCSQR